MKLTSLLPAMLLATLLSLTGLHAAADGHEPPPQPVLETFLCNYMDGKDRGDLDSATEYYLKQAERNGVETPDAYLWTKIKGTGADIAWHNVHDNLDAFAARVDDVEANQAMTSVQERYDTVADCMPMLGTVTQIHQTGDSDGGEGRFVAAYACNASGPSGADEMGDLNRHIGGVFGAIGDAAPLSTYMITPMVGDASGPDAVYFNVFSSASHWSSLGTTLNGSDGGQMLVRHFNSMLNCSANLWASEQVIGGE